MNCMVRCCLKLSIHATFTGNKTENRTSSLIHFILFRLFVPSIIHLALGASCYASYFHVYDLSGTCSDVFDVYSQLPMFAHMYWAGVWSGCWSWPGEYCMSCAVRTLVRGAIPCLQICFFATRHVTNTPLEETNNLNSSKQSNQARSLCPVTIFRITMTRTHAGTTRALLSGTTPRWVVSSCPVMATHSCAHNCATSPTSIWWRV